MASYTLDQIVYRASIRSGSNYVNYEEFRVVKPTPKGAWIYPYWRGSPSSTDLTFEAIQASDSSIKSELKWIPWGARFASTTKEDALARLKARTRSYLKHCRRRMKEAERRAAILNEGHPDLVKGLPTLKTLDYFRDSGR